jgi:phosphonate utilization associated putative membrane protein
MPGLSPHVLLAVLVGALLHASWNALVKSSTDKTLDTALIHVLCSFYAVPVCLYLGPPDPQVWPYIAASLVVHVAYYFALAGAYRHGDLGLAYPLMRGTAPVLVALSSFIVLGEALTPLAWLGVLCVSCGLFLLGAGGAMLAQKKAVVFALSNAVLIAIYTVVDAKGARLSGHVLQYAAMLFALDGWPFALLVLWQRKGAVMPYVRVRWRLAAGGAAASLASYSIALWAMTMAPVALIAALRETSVLFAAILGAWLLKEPWTRPRVLGTVSIVLGVMALRLA